MFLSYMVHCLLIANESSEKNLSRLRSAARYAQNGI